MQFHLLRGQDILFISKECGDTELLLCNYHPCCLPLSKAKRKAKGQAWSSLIRIPPPPKCCHKNQTLVFKESYCCVPEWRNTELVTARISLTFHKEQCSGSISPGKFFRYFFLNKVMDLKREYSCNIWSILPDGSISKCYTDTLHVFQAL